jgi:hypothetical protein
LWRELVEGKRVGIGREGVGEAERRAVVGRKERSEVVDEVIGRK